MARFPICWLVKVRMGWWQPPQSADEPIPSCSHEIPCSIAWFDIRFFFWKIFQVTVSVYYSIVSILEGEMMRNPYFWLWEQVQYRTRPHGSCSKISNFWCSPGFFRFETFLQEVLCGKSAAPPNVVAKNHDFPVDFPLNKSIFRMLRIWRTFFV